MAGLTAFFSVLEIHFNVIGGSTDGAVVFLQSIDWSRLNDLVTTEQSPLIKLAFDFKDLREIPPYENMIKERVSDRTRGRLVFLPIERDTR